MPVTSQMIPNCVHSWVPAECLWEIDVHGGSSREPTGEIALSEIQIVFVNVFICPETMKRNPESLRETHFEATVACFEFRWQIGRKSSIPQFGIIWLVDAIN